MMSKGVSAVLWVMVVVMAEIHETAAVNCTPAELLPCLPAITGGQTPSETCCYKLKEQQPCFCQYISNPSYKTYIDSPNAKKVAATCGVSIPTTC